jgi:hypothetical protein
MAEFDRAQIEQRIASVRSRLGAHRGDEQEAARLSACLAEIDRLTFIIEAARETDDLKPLDIVAPQDWDEYQQYVSTVPAGTEELTYLDWKHAGKPGGGEAVDNWLKGMEELGI